MYSKIAAICARSCWLAARLVWNRCSIVRTTSGNSRYGLSNSVSYEQLLAHTRPRQVHLPQSRVWVRHVWLRQKT
jgi:hypothetical protein